MQSEDCPAPDPGVRAWLASFEAAAAAAQQRMRGAEWMLGLAGIRIHLRTSGPTVAKWLQPALAHALQPLDRGPADFELVIWDQAATGVLPPSPFRDALGRASRGELPALRADGILAAYHEDAGYFAAFDPERRRAWIWVRDAATLPRYERAAPLRGPLSWLVAAGGAQFAHAAAIATPRGAALLAGPGGSGKSTTAMACLAAGLGYLGDDYVLVGESGGSPEVHALYATAKLTEHGFELLPALRALADGPGNAREKAVIQLAQTPFGDRLVAKAPIAAIVLPRIGDGAETRWEPATASRALTALAPTTLFQLPGAGSDALARLARLARSVPAVTLHLGRDMRGIAPALCAAVATVAS